ncbi:hypothetical protein KKF84_15620 [Myxococcota bacterium]|nr:hypothetical protein [Myxococcota bacterium]
MTKSDRMDALSRLKGLMERVKELESAQKSLAEDLAYHIKLYLRGTGTTREEWCERMGLDRNDLDAALHEESYFSLARYAQIILGGRVTPMVIPQAPGLNDSPLMRLRRSVLTEDAQRVWASISYYILVNHKNTKSFCDTLTEAGLEIKYSTFRTDKHHCKLSTALKYIGLIEEFHQQRPRGE